MTNQVTRPPIWIVLPNAGLGSRFGRTIPKQYSLIGNKTLIEWTIQALLKVKGIDGFIIANHENDGLWKDIPLNTNTRFVEVTGGNERVDSVYAAVSKVNEMTLGKGWVLVHDVARPLVTSTSINTLIDKCLKNNTGGILANRVVDTLKYTEENLVARTQSRVNLWHAQTPQFFPSNLLVQAIEKARSLGLAITDESSAIEAIHKDVLIVENTGINIKVTYPEDFDFVSYMLLKGEL